MKKLYLFTLLGLVFFCLSGCTPPPRPHNVHDICGVFQQYPTWYWDTQAVQKRWKLPINVTMAIILQESHFNSTIKPPREKILWVIPWFRPTSSFGYAQVVESTWRRYQRETGHTGANRDDFGDAVDFIGWYTYKAHLRLGIQQTDAYHLYLAYHEGMGGYSRGTYKRKRWLIAVAKKVARHAWLYKVQLKRCAATLPQKPWWRFW